METSNLDLTGFQAFLLNKGLKSTTVERHLYMMAKIVPEIDELNSRSISIYLAKLKLQNKRHSYINHYLSAAQNYCAYLGLEPLKLSWYKQQSFAKATLSDSEIEEFLSLPPVRKGDKEETNYKMWTVFFSIFAYCGMRPNEISNLKVVDCDFGKGVFVLHDTKINEPRFVPIPSNLEDTVRAYVEDKTDYLFTTRQYGAKVVKTFSRAAWNYSFHSRIKRLGIVRTNLTPYSLRHSLITRLLEEDVNLFKVQKIVGHKRLETTQQYTHLTTKDIKRAIEKDRLGRTNKSPRLLLQALLDAVTGLFDRDQRFERSIEDKGDEIVIRIRIKNQPSFPD